MPRPSLGHRSAQRTLLASQLRTLTGEPLPAVASSSDSSSLMLSIRRHGVLVPILVTHFPEDEAEVFRVIDGRRRAMALQHINPGVGIPCRVLSGLTPTDIAEVLLTANLQRSVNYRAEVAAYLSREQARAFPETPTPGDPLTLLPALRHRQMLARLPEHMRRLFLHGNISHATASRLARASVEVRAEWDRIVNNTPRGQLTQQGYASALVMAEESVARLQGSLDLGPVTGGRVRFQFVPPPDGRVRQPHLGAQLTGAQIAEARRQAVAMSEAMQRHTGMAPTEVRVGVDAAQEGREQTVTLRITDSIPAMRGDTAHEVLNSLMALMSFVVGEDLEQSDAITQLLREAFIQIARLVALDPYQLLEA